MKVKVNRFTKEVEVKYFLIEIRLKEVIAIVRETNKYVYYYNMWLVKEFDEFTNQEEWRTVANPTGNGYHNGKPNRLLKSKIDEGFEGDWIDITLDYKLVMATLKGEKKVAVRIN